MVTNIPKLAAVLNYTNSKIVAYFCFKNPQYLAAEAEQLFNDLLSWIWLSVVRKQQGKKSHLFGPLLILDEFWHIFILHTKEYIDFSLHYFGEYIHHEVEPPGLEHNLEEEELSEYLEDCMNFLGVSWVERRFAHAFL